MIEVTMTFFVEDLKEVKDLAIYFLKHSIPRAPVPPNGNYCTEKIGDDNGQFARLQIHRVEDEQWQLMKSMSPKKKTLSKQTN